MTYLVDLVEPSGGVLTFTCPDLTPEAISRAIRALPDCPACDGTGYAPKRPLSASREHCGACEGHGKVVDQ